MCAVSCGLHCKTSVYLSLSQYLLYNTNFLLIPYPHPLLLLMQAFPVPRALCGTQMTSSTNPVKKYSLGLKSCWICRLNPAVRWEQNFSARDRGRAAWGGEKEEKEAWDLSLQRWAGGRSVWLILCMVTNVTCFESKWPVVGSSPGSSSRTQYSRKRASFNKHVKTWVLLHCFLY